MKTFLLLLLVAGYLAYLMMRGDRAKKRAAIEEAARTRAEAAVQRRMGSVDLVECPSCKAHRPAGEGACPTPGCPEGRA